jgi:hypothetical protein
MAQDIGYDFAAGPTVTLLSSNLTDASSSALTSAVDFGDPTPVAFGYELKLDGQASADGFAFLEAAWSHDNTDFSDTSNVEIVATVDCTASTVAVKVGASEIKGQYAKFRLRNESGGTINSASTALVLFDIFLNQV